MESFHMLHRSTKFSMPSFDSSASITPSQLRMLMALEGQNDSSLKEVANLLNVTSSAATQLVDGLVANGYVTRKENPEDRRKMTITISNKTKKKIAKMKEQNITQLLDLFKVLSDKELNQFLALHKKVIRGSLKFKN